MRHASRAKTGTAMKHPSTRALFDYWNRRRGRCSVPSRSDIDPADIRHVLGDTFMLTTDFVDEIRFRLAGTRVCALFARELKGEAFNNLWDDPSRECINRLLASVIGENEGLVAGVRGRTEDTATVELELLLLPLAVDGKTCIRALGVLAPLKPPYWLGERPIIDLDLRTLRNVGAKQLLVAGPHFGLPNEQPRARHGFLVYSGGRELPTDRRTS